MKYIQLSIVALFFVLAACSQQATQETPTASVETAEQKIGDVQVDTAKAMTMTTFVSMMQGRDSLLDCTVAGKVVEVCQKKGCWMEIERENGQTMHVTFKDYALFMPKDIAGRQVVLHGKAAVETIPVEQLKHLAKDGGKTDEEIAKISQPRTDIIFEADGVIIK